MQASTTGFSLNSIYPQQFDNRNECGHTRYYHEPQVNLDTEEDCCSKIFTRSHCSILHTGITGAARIYEGFETAWSFAPVRNLLPRKWHEGIINFYVSLNPTLQIFNTLAIIGLINDVPKIIKRTYQFAHSSELERFDGAMKALRAVGTMFQNIAFSLFGIEGLHIATRLENVNLTMFATAVKTATAYANTFLALGTLLALTDIVIHARKLRKIEEFTRHFFQYAGVKLNGRYREEDYQKFVQYLQTVNERDLKSHFQVDGKLLKARLLQICSAKHPDQCDLQNFKKVITKLQGRLESTKTTYRVCLIADAANILSMALIISGIFHPLGFVLLGICTLGRLLAYVQRKISAYAFENRIGLIARDTEHDIYGLKNLFNERPHEPLGTMERVKDFGKWFFGFYKHIPIPSLPDISFPDIS